MTLPSSTTSGSASSSSKDWILIIASFGLPYFFAHYFFSKYFFRDIALSSRIEYLIQATFAGTVASTFQLHFSLLLELLGIISLQRRNEVWMLDFVLCILLLKVVIPMLVAFTVFKTIIYSAKWTRKVVLICIVLEVIWLYVNYYDVYSGGYQSIIEKDVEQIGLVGLTIVSLLAGYGAVNGPMQYGPWLIKKYDDAQIKIVENKLLNVMNVISQQKQELLLYSSNNKATRGEQQAALDYSPLARELFLELKEMNAAKKLHFFRQTWLGKSYTMLGYWYAVYCLIKAFSSVYSLLTPRNINDIDIITKLIYLVLSTLFSSETKETTMIWTHSISFLLIGILVFNSFRSLLMTLGKLFHKYGNFFSHLTVALFLIAVFGHYMVTSIILLNLNLPLPYRSASFERFEFFRAYFDFFFLVSCATSLVVLLIIDRSTKSRTEFYSDDLLQAKIT